MVALNPAYFADVQAPLTRGGLGHDRRIGTEGLGGYDSAQPKNRVGDFFCEAHDCTEGSHPAARILTIEIHLYLYDPTSGCYKYLYAHAAPTRYVDPSGNLTLNQVLATTAIVGILANMAITSFALDNISEAGWTNPSQIFAGANVRGSASTGRGIGISGSFGISFIYDLASGDIYGVLNAKSSLNIFSSLKKGVKFKGFEGYAGFIWNNEPKTGAGVSGFTGFTAYMSVGTMRVALIAFKSVINPQIRASLLDISRKLANSRFKNARIALSVGSEKKTELSVSIYSSSASNSPIGVGTLSFFGADRVHEN